MIVRATRSPSDAARKAFKRSTLLVGASLVVLLGTMAKADARALGGGSGAGAAVGDPSVAAAAAAAASARQSSAAAQQAIQSMARAAQSLQAIRDAQSAARAAALAATGSAVPNGLVAGGLVVAPDAATTPGLWVGADQPKPGQEGGRTQVEIRQTEAKAILNWSSFNVGRETDVYFNQTAGGADKANWIALNRVTDPSLAPTRILGTIKAEGQVYVINKNGIVFGGASQVNVNSFVASSLSLSDEQFRAGINKQLFIFDDVNSGASIAKPQFGYLGQQSPDQFLGLNAAGQVAGAVIGAAPGDVRLEAGAQLTMASGGKALIFAPHVVNSGHITAPDGQVVMAAGEQIYLMTDRSGIRGLDIAVSAPMRWVFDYYHMATATKQGNWVNQNDYQVGLEQIVFPEMAARAASVGYSVVNNGMVKADHGNITLMSRAIVQNGALEASTALNNRDGSIRLRAWGDGMMSYGSSMPEGSPLRYWSTGAVTLGVGSVTTAMPDLTDASDIEQTSLGTRYSTGRIEMRGKLIDIGARANVIVPAGTISIVASTLTTAGETPITGDLNLYDGSRVYIGEDAYLSVAGLQNILLTMESNTVAGELRINELRDSPLYRDSWLRGKSVSVDKRVSGLFGDGPMAGVQWVENSPGKWVGTPLADLSGWIGVGKTTLGELSTKAGAIIIKSSGDIITRAGSLFDVSGGSVRYQDGWITTTKLVGADGRIYDIGKAMPDQLYVSFAGSFSRTHNVQGRLDPHLTETWTTVFDRGQSRRFERGYTEGRDAGSIRIFAASALVLDGGYWGGTINGEHQVQSDESAAGGSFTIGGGSDEYGRWLIGDLIIAGRPLTLPEGFTSTSALDPRWNVAPQLKPPVPDPNDPVKTIPLDPSFPANWIEPIKKTYLDSDILAESGMATYNFFVRNSFTLGKEERLELAPASRFSVTVNSSAPSTFTIDGSIRIVGGTVSLAGGKTALYGADASIDVSGEWRNGPPGDRAPVINGGSITVTGEFALGFVLDVSGGGWYDTANTKKKLKFGDAGSLSLSPTDTSQLANLDLRGYSAASGGTLSINTSGSVQVGGSAPTDPILGWIPSSLFSERGFRGFALATTGDVVVVENAAISQLPLSVDLVNINPADVSSGARIGELGPLVVKPLAERVAYKPTSLSLVGDHVVIGAGAVVHTDVGGSITLNAIGHNDSANVNVPGHLIVHGTIDAPAGTIALSTTGELKLTASARILATGTAVVDRDVWGVRSGSVMAGGTVSFNNAAAMTLETGSLIDVSGASGEFDIDNGRNGRESYTLTSNGGSISLAYSGRSQDFVNPTFMAHAGGAGSTGGTLNLSVGSVFETSAGYLLPTTLYYINRTTGAITPLALTGNLDLYKEYSSGVDPAFRLSAIRLPIRNGTANLVRGGGLGIVDLDSDTSAATISQPLAWVLPTYESQIALLNKYFYTNSTATIRVSSLLPTPTIKMTKMSADAINGSGIGSLNVNATAFVIAPGVNLSFGKSASITSDIYSGGAGAASLAAPYIRLLSGGGRAGAAGSGKLTMTADLIDVTRATFTGFEETELVAGDLRLGGLLTDLTLNRTAYLTADGGLELRVAQVYPATGVLASIKAGARISIERNGEAALPLSAAGTLTLESPVIEQNGIVRAPFGSIVFLATDSITLGAQSITAVSGDGLILPYGKLSNDEFWVDPLTKPKDNTPPPALSKLPEKNIVLQGPKVNLAAGSVIDIRGGGDLIASEHVPGPGGSHDVLAPTSVYAIVPGMNVSSASQQKIWLAGGNGLAAGWYALLPAHYALLPGAFAVSVVKGTENGRLSSSVTLADGSLLTGGRLADAFGGGGEQVNSTWRFMSGATLRSYSEYNEASANTFFASEAFKLSQYRLTGIDVVTPRLPMDGGAVVFKAGSELVLDGTLRSQPAAGGRGGLVDIAGSKIAIVGAGQDRSNLAGYLVVDANSLTNFGAGSLLIGGVRSGAALGLRIDVTASDVLIRNDASSVLAGSEILLAASGTLDVASGSVIVARGGSPGSGVDLVMAPKVAAVYGDLGVGDTDPTNDVLLTPSKDYGALIRVSTGDAVKVLRENVDTSIGGVVTIGASATLSGGNALLIDATRNTNVAGSARLSGAALSLSSGRIGFGGGNGGLVLDAGSLAQLATTQALTLRSYSTMDFYTSINLGGAGLSSVTFDSAGIVGFGTGSIVVAGGIIALENSAGAFSSPGGAGHINLSLIADQIVLGSGDKTLRGFDTVVLNAKHQITGQGQGAVDAGAAAVTLITPVVTGRGGASQSIVTQNAIRAIGSDGTAIDSPEASLGTRFALTGTSVDVTGRIVALGGAVNLTATNGNVTIGQGGLVDVGGFAKQFFDVAQYADAGSIALTAAGSVIVAPGGQLNLSAHAEGGAAGRLSLVASNGGTVVLGGLIDAHAAAGQTGGSFALDIATLPDFAGMSQTLNASGFTASRQFRIRSGSVVVDGLTQVSNFSLVADQGSVTLAGTIDARSEFGGNVVVTAGNGLTMVTSGNIFAGSTGEFGSGRVTLEASGGQLDIQGGTINVAGADGGRVRFRARQSGGQQDAHTDVDVANLRATIIGSRSTVLEGVWLHDQVTTIDATLRDKANDIANLFMTHAGGIASRLQFGSDIVVVSGVEISSTANGDLTLGVDWDLSGLTAREGSLTLRSAGNLVILGNLSDGFASADRNALLQNARSWDLRLVSGADLSSANALAVKPRSALPTGSGNLLIGDTSAGNFVRTGTGDLTVMAGRDLFLADAKSAIYTAGRADQTVFADFITPTGAVYGIDGGNLRITTQGNAVAALPAATTENQLFIEWLKKTGGTDKDFVFPSGHQSSWWVDHSKFHQGIGALGGGNVLVTTGGDLVNMLVALPTNGRVRGGLSVNAPKTLEVRNGGEMSVDVGGAVRAGAFYIGRGAATIAAGEFAAGRSVDVQFDAGTFRYAIAPILALGDATMRVRTAGNLTVQTVMDPLLLNADPRWSRDDGDEFSAYMSGYTKRTAIDLVSVGGDVTLVNQGRFLSQDLDLRGGYSDNPVGFGYSMVGLLATNLYPSMTRISALNGSVNNLSRFFTAPGGYPELRILADVDVTLGEIIMSRATLEMMPSPFRPISGGSALFGTKYIIDAQATEFQMVGEGYSGFHNILQNKIGVIGDTIGYNGITDYVNDVRNPDRLLNQDDYEPSRIFARTGSILGTPFLGAKRARLGKVVTNEQTWFRAGRDIRNIDYDLRNVHRTDVSLLEAGTDIIGGKIDIQGPGAIALGAGRDVYGTAFEIFSRGNYQDYPQNRAAELSEIKGLPRDGAAITVMAGLKGKQPSYDALVAAYLDPANVAAMPDYLKTTVDGVSLPIYLVDAFEKRSGDELQTRSGLVSFIKDITGEKLSPLAAWARFKSLPALTQQRFVRDLYSQELKAAGDDQNTVGADGQPINGGYNRGYTAIAALFPGQDWGGDVKIGSATFRTMAGGNIETLTPGGGLQVAALGMSVPDGGGLVTLGTGDINVFARDSVTVNRSRVLTFAGGDEVMWSTLGDIDAGRGAKTTRAPSGPEITTDDDAVTTVKERADIGGSGIGTVIGFTGVKPGDVSLIAPEGTVNAGDAGIRVSGNFTVAAMFVLNADNIKVGGETKGMPKALVAPVTFSPETKDKSASDAVKDATQAGAAERPSVIIVEVLGYGGGNESPRQEGVESEEERRRRGGQRSYNTNSVIQLVGNGALSQEQSDALTDEEKQRLQAIARAARSR